ncbi:MAG: DUF2059 domain-containing protein [Lentisphaerota bacterium]
MHWLNRIGCSIAALAVLSGITGCSTANPTPGYIAAVEQNKHLEPADLYKENLENMGLNTELYLMEKGRLAQLEGDFKTSRASFNEQVDILKQRELDDNTLPGAEINTGSVLVNDNMLPYKARLFEVEMIYLSQSFNYLAQGDMEGAVVEIRNADFLLNEAEKARSGKEFKEEGFRNSEAGVQKKLFENQKAIQEKSKAGQQAVQSAANPEIPAAAPAASPAQAAAVAALPVPAITAPAESPAVQAAPAVSPELAKRKELSEKLIADLKVGDRVTITLKKSKTVNKDVNWGNLKDQFVNLYADIFSAEELDALIKFYESPTGRKLIEKQPEIQKKIAQLLRNQKTVLSPKTGETAINTDATTPPATLNAQVDPVDQAKRKELSGKLISDLKIGDRYMKTKGKEINWDQHKNQVADLYADTFSAEELDALVKFCESPSGKKFIDKQPEIQQKSIELISPPQIAVAAAAPLPKKTEEETKRAEYEKKSEQAYEKSFAEMAEVLAKAKSSVLNPYVLYVSGIIHEMNGELDDAYISYKKGLEVMPSNPYLQMDVVRLARRLNKTNDFDKLKSTYPELWKQFESTVSSGKDGRLVVLYEYGWAPRKKEIFISMAAVAVAYPVYQFKWCEASPMLVSSELGEIGPTSPICYMNALALRALKEEAKWRIIRQSARVVVKGSVFAAGTTMAAAGGNTGVQAAGIAIMAASAVYNNMSENADLRSFMTLPENVQTLAADMPAGTHKITFAPQGTQLRLEESVPVIAGKTTIVRVVQVGPRLIYQQLWPAVAPAVKSNTDHAEAQSNKPQEGNKL